MGFSTLSFISQFCIGVLCTFRLCKIQNSKSVLCFMKLKTLGKVSFLADGNKIHFHSQTFPQILESPPSSLLLPLTNFHPFTWQVFNVTSVKKMSFNVESTYLVFIWKAYSKIYNKTPKNLAKCVQIDQVYCHGKLIVLS